MKENLIQLATVSKSTEQRSSAYQRFLFFAAGIGLVLSGCQREPASAVPSTEPVVSAVATAEASPTPVKITVNADNQTDERNGARGASKKIEIKQIITLAVNKEFSVRTLEEILATGGTFTLNTNSETGPVSITYRVTKRFLGNSSGYEIRPEPKTDQDPASATIFVDQDGSFGVSHEPEDVQKVEFNQDGVTISFILQKTAKKITTNK